MSEYLVLGIMLGAAIALFIAAKISDKGNKK